MRRSEIEELFAYNRWANERVLDAIEALDDEAFTRDLGGSFPSVRDTLAHVIGAEWIWLQRWKGTSPTRPPDDWDSADLTRLRRFYAEVEAEQGAFIASLTDADLDREIFYRTLSGQAYSNRLWQLLRHLINHSSYHRGQITMMLRQLGATPAATDLILYDRERAVKA